MHVLLTYNRIHLLKLTPCIPNFSFKMSEISAHKCESLEILQYFNLQRNISSRSIYLLYYIKFSYHMHIKKHSVKLASCHSVCQLKLSKYRSDISQKCTEVELPNKQREKNYPFLEITYVKEETLKSIGTFI